MLERSFQMEFFLDSCIFIGNLEWKDRNPKISSDSYFNLHVASHDDQTQMINILGPKCNFRKFNCQKWVGLPTVKSSIAKSATVKGSVVKCGLDKVHVDGVHTYGIG